MAKTIENGEKKPGFAAKVGGGVMKFFAKIGKSFKDMIAELKKVSWPDRKALLNYSLVVIVFMVAMGLIILGIDSIAAALTQLITA